MIGVVFRVRMVVLVNGDLLGFVPQPNLLAGVVDGTRI